MDEIYEKAEMRCAYSCHWVLLLRSHMAIWVVDLQGHFYEVAVRVCQEMAGRGCFKVMPWESAGAGNGSIHNKMRATRLCHDSGAV